VHASCYNRTRTRLQRSGWGLASAGAWPSRYYSKLEPPADVAHLVARLFKVVHGRTEVVWVPPPATARRDHTLALEE
jgi:hypothetical protein